MTKRPADDFVPTVSIAEGRYDNPRHTCKSSLSVGITGATSPAIDSARALESSDVQSQPGRTAAPIQTQTLATAVALAVTFALLLISSAQAHVAGCHTRKCDRRIHAKRAAHWCRTHAVCLWRHRWVRIDPALKERLARLRYCESTNNYRAVNGQYTGAYQYAASTWARAGGSGLAMNAPPREQDVRTAWFYPSHSSEWECRA